MWPGAHLLFIQNKLGNTLGSSCHTYLCMCFSKKKVKRNTLACYRLVAGDQHGKSNIIINWYGIRPFKNQLTCRLKRLLTEHEKYVFVFIYCASVINGMS